MDTERQMAYWRDSAADDLDAAAILMGRRKARHGLFFAHLALEKALKAHVVRATQAFPPRTHNLLSLSRRSGMELSEDLVGFLNTFDLYQLEGRYPDVDQAMLDIDTAEQEFRRAQEVC